MKTEEKDQHIKDLKASLKSLAGTKDAEIKALKSGIAQLEETIERLNANIDEESSGQINRMVNIETEKLTAERDQAIKLISDLSQQIADQSTVKTETEILVKVDGKQYLLEKRSMHTLEGEVKAEDAAKDMDFLRNLIANGSGNIWLADK